METNRTVGPLGSWERSLAMKPIDPLLLKPVREKVCPERRRRNDIAVTSVDSDLFWETKIKE